MFQLFRCAVFRYPLYKVYPISSDIVWTYSEKKITWINWMVKALFPTPPAVNKKNKKIDKVQQKKNLNGLQINWGGFLSQ